MKKIPNIQQQLNDRADAALKAEIDNCMNPLFDLFQKHKNENGHATVNLNGHGSLNAYGGAWWTSCKEAMFAICCDNYRAQYAAEFIAKVEEVSRMLEP